MAEAKKYDKLFSVEDYDKDAAEQLADATNELREVMSRAQYLEELIRENKKLHIFIWTTADGETRAIHNLEDDHLKNILQWQINHGQTINKGLKSEARKRNIDIPDRRAIIDRDAVRRLGYDDMGEVWEALQDGSSNR